MRNWNVLASAALYCSITIYNTYEELKLLFFTVKLYIRIGFIIPMRNWNRSTLSRAGSRNRWFIIPMRNWNLYFLRYNRIIVIGIYNTYEELKPYYLWTTAIAISWFIIPMRNWNYPFAFWKSRISSKIYNTYEELKPITRIKSNYWLISIYNTYEELKPEM